VRIIILSGLSGSGKSVALHTLEDFGFYCIDNIPAALLKPFIDLRHGATTGIPAAERARTIRALADPGSRPEDLARPGHIFPIRAARGGVLDRAGHTEAAVDLSRLAGLCGVTTICEVVLADWSMARYHDLRELADAEDLALISVGDLIAHRRAQLRLPAARSS
jgi:3,4-dihydroxy-2-butanone 4-phosphate synthase